MTKTRSSTRTSKMAISSKNRKKSASHSTPKNTRVESPSRDSDSICESDTASPVPFLCTQDGADGDTDVVWNYYTPKADNRPITRIKNSTPLSTRSKRVTKSKDLKSPLPRRNKVRGPQKNTQLLQDLMELNENLHQFIDKKTNKDQNEHLPSESEEDIFNNSNDYSPKSLKPNSRCLRKNLLSSKFNKVDNEVALESDDSMNECLVTASQMIEDKILKSEVTPVRKPERVSILQMDQDSMDAILNCINFDSPIQHKIKKSESPHTGNDSFDNFVDNLNDSALDKLTQLPMKMETPNRSLKKSQWVIKEVQIHESPSSKFFGRHSSMPESPRIVNVSEPSTSGRTFGRHSSMPHDNQEPGETSPIRCTPDEIERKHKQAREKLLAKRLLPFTANTQENETQKNTQSQSTYKRTLFQPKVASTNKNPISRVHCLPVQTSSAKNNSSQNVNKSLDLRQIIEKKRQEALMKLRKRQPQK